MVVCKGWKQPSQLLLTVCQWLFILRCWRLEIYLLKQELLIVSIMTNTVNCTAHEEECQQSEKAVSYLSDSSNISGLNKSTGRVLKLFSTWISALEKVPLGGFSEWERTYHGLMGMQRHFTVISTSRQQTNTHHKASSPCTDKEIQPSTASIVTMKKTEKQITLDGSGPSGITTSLTS